MRFLHTSDWHLGRSLCNWRRDEAFQHFLDWLQDLIVRERVDTLIVAGDIFDTTTPPHHAQELYYSFLTGLIRGNTCRNVVIVGGNHDSPSFLNAAGELLRFLRITVVGEALEPDEEIVELKNADGQTTGLVCAVPFLRERDITHGVDVDSMTARETRITDGTALHYRRVIERADALRAELADPNVPLIVTGHLFVINGKASESTRDLYVGGLGQVSADIFGTEPDYVALGHLHVPQTLGGNPTRNYCGAPMPFDFSEAESERFVNIVDTAGRACTVTKVPVPAFDTLKRISGSEAELKAAVRALVDEGKPVLVEACHTVDEATAGLSRELAALTAGTPVAILKTTEVARQAAMLAGEDLTMALSSMTPEAMFRKLLEIREIPDAEQASLTEAYNEILYAVENADADDAADKKRSDSGAAK